jgi:hypothetical protein
MANDINTTTTPLATAPALTAEGIKILAAHVGTLPTSTHPERLAFGHRYAAGTYTSTTDHGVQALVFALRNAGGVGANSYRTVAEAIGAQCSMLTERAYGAHVRRNKLSADEVRTMTGGRAAKAAALVPVPAKTA